MKKTAKVLSKMTLGVSSVFVKASSPGLHIPKIPQSLKKAK